MTSLPRLGVLAAAGGVALLSAACTLSIDTSDDTVSRSFDVDSFNEVDIAQAFEAEIVVGETTSVEVEISSELLDLLEVEVVDERLSVAVGGGLISTSGPLRVTITTPELTAVTASGAAELEIEDLKAADFKLDVDGASDVSVDGSITSLTLNVSGAASVDLDDTAVDAAIVDIDGASNVELTDVSSVSGTVSGASNIDVPDSGTVDINASGDSSID